MAFVGDVAVWVKLAVEYLRSMDRGRISPDAYESARLHTIVRIRVAGIEVYPSFEPVVICAFARVRGLLPNKMIAGTRGASLW